VDLSRPDKIIPLQVRNGYRSESKGSHATKNPPENPTDLTAHENHLG